MSLIPPNVSLINKVEYKISLDKGKYKISIVASVVNDDFPLITAYDFLHIEVTNRVNITIILPLSISCILLTVTLVVLIAFCKRKNKRDEFELLRDEKKTKFLSALGFNESDEKEGIIFNNNDEDENNIENNKNKDKVDCLENIDENNENEFSISSE